MLVFRRVIEGAPTMYDLPPVDHVATPEQLAAELASALPEPPRFTAAPRPDLSPRLSAAPTAGVSPRLGPAATTGRVSPFPLTAVERKD